MEKSGVLKVMIELSKRRHSAGVVGNKDIYKEVTGLVNYRKHRWEELRLVLKEIALEVWIKVDDDNYIFSPFSPMFRSKYNFYVGNHNPEKLIYGIPVAGFSIKKDFNPS